MSSTSSSPIVNYKVTHTTTRASNTTAAISVRLTFYSWLNSSASKLGTGIKLTIYARINGGSWSSVVLKNTSESWSGTTTHSVSLTLSASTTASTAKIEFYTSRTGSTYSGTAGALGSAGSPKSYTITVPSYTATKYGVTYSVSGDVPAGYAAPTDSATYTSGSTVTVKPAPSVSGYAFAGWYLNGSVVSSFKITGNATLTGVWTQTQKYIYVNAGGVWKKAALYVNVGGMWKKSTAAYVNVSGTWKSN